MGIYRHQALVFGMFWYEEEESIVDPLVLDVSLREMLAQTVSRAAILWRSDPEKNLESLGTRILGRSQTPEIALTRAKTTELQDILFDEVFYTLEEPLKSFHE